jgi:hypothetical protein
MSQIENERGSILLEALVSGILLVITAVGVFSAFGHARIRRGATPRPGRGLGAG